jgi:hypothetical protein
MKSYRTFFSATSLALAAAITIGSAQAALAGSKTRASEPFRLTGVIVDYDRDARTLTVKSTGENRLTVVHVPEGRSVRLSKFGNSATAPSNVNFEHAQRGQHVNLSVKRTETLAMAIANE